MAEKETDAVTSSYPSPLGLSSLLSLPPSPPVSPCAGCWKRTEKPKRGSFERGASETLSLPPSSLHFSGKKAGKGQSFSLSNI